MRLFGRISHNSTCSTRSTPSTSCVCHPSVALVCVWIWQTQSPAEKYSGTFVFTAPVAEPTLMSFTVPLNGSTIVATATIVTSYSSSADCPDSAAPMSCGSVCVAMSCGGGFFTPDGAYDSVWNSVRSMTGKYIINYFQYQEVVGCVCMLNSWFSSNDDICARQLPLLWS